MVLAFAARATIVLRRWAVQGKPAARRGRKARDLGITRGRPAADPLVSSRRRGVGNVKANLARFTTAIALLATIALSLGAGMRWY
jgi:hypothetical protein